MIRRPPRSTHCISSAASDVYKRQMVENEDADAALVPAENDGWELVSKGDAPASVTTTVNQIVASQAQATALDTLNIDPQELEKATPSTTVNQVNLEEEDDTDQKMAGVATVLIAAMVVVFSNSCGSILSVSSAVACA